MHAPRGRKRERSKRTTEGARRTERTRRRTQRQESQPFSNDAVSWRGGCNDSLQIQHVSVHAASHHENAENIICAPSKTILHRASLEIWKDILKQPATNQGNKSLRRFRSCRAVHVADFEASDSFTQLCAFDQFMQASCRQCHKQFHTYRFKSSRISCEAARKIGSNFEAA